MRSRENMMLTKSIKDNLIKMKNLTLLRERRVAEFSKDNKIHIKDKTYIDFSSNDYLGLRKHPKISEAFINAVKQYGFGSGASTCISGYSKAHEKLEASFAKWLGVDKALVFSSGYLANIGTISALANRSSTFFSDKLCHASLLDGLILSRAKHVRYQHNNIQHLQQLATMHKPDFIVTESVFSMEGDMADVPAIVKLAKTYQSALFIDDAHGIGILGEQGQGVINHFGLKSEDFACLILPLGKAFNAMGAIVAGSSTMISAILQLSRAYRYTTALPAALCSAIQSTLHIVQEEEWRRLQLRKNIHCFISYAREKKLCLTSEAETPIKTLIIGDNQKVLLLQDFLLSQGFYVAAIRPPTVLKGTARLRISLNSLHHQEEMIALIDHIAKWLNTRI